MTAGVSGAGAPPPPPPSSSKTAGKVGGKAKKKTKHTDEKPKTGKSDKKPKLTSTTTLRKLLGLKSSAQKESLQLSNYIDIALANPNFLSTEGIFRVSGSEAENKKAAKSPSKYFNKNANTSAENQLHAMASLIKNQLKSSLSVEEKILLALMAGVKPDDLKKHIDPEHAGAVDRVVARIDSGELGNQYPPLFMIIARLCHAVAANPNNRMDMNAIVTCIAPNLTPDVGTVSADPRAAMNFVIQMNQQMGALISSMMTGAAPTAVTGTADSIYSVVNTAGSTQPLYRRMTNAMSVRPGPSTEPDVIYATGLSWKSPDGKEVSLGGVGIADTDSDSDSSTKSKKSTSSSSVHSSSSDSDSDGPSGPSGSGGAAGSSSAARPAADPDTGADGRGGRDAADSGSTGAAPYALRPRTATTGATPHPALEDTPAPPVPPRAPVGVETRAAAAAKRKKEEEKKAKSDEKAKRKADRAQRREDKAKKKAEKKKTSTEHKKPVISRPILTSDSSSESSSASPEAKRKLIMPIPVKPAPPHPSRTDDSTGESTHLTRAQLAALRKQIADEESSASSSSSPSPSPAPDGEEPTHMSREDLLALAGQSSIAPTPPTSSGMMTRSKAVGEQDKKPKPPSRPTKSKYATLDELEPHEDDDTDGLFDGHGFRIEQAPSPKRSPHAGPGPKTGEIYTALGPRTQKAPTPAPSTEQKPVVEDEPAPPLPPRGGISGQSSTSASGSSTSLSKSGVVTRSRKAAAAPPPLPPKGVPKTKHSGQSPIPVDPTTPPISVLRRSSPVISGGTVKPKPTSESSKEAPKRGRAAVRYPEPKDGSSSSSASPVRKKPATAPSTSTGTGSSSSSSSTRPVTRSSTAATSSSSAGASATTRRPTPPSKPVETELQRAFRLRREKKQ